MNRTVERLRAEQLLAARVKDMDAYLLLGKVLRIIEEESIPKPDNMRHFNELSHKEKQEIRKKFVIPESTHLLVDDFDRPFEVILGKLVGCTVRNTNFHLHENKAKQF